LVRRGREELMTDVVMVVAAAAFFVLAFALVRWFDRI
jgi:preprotein translocase subunit SecE